MLSEKEQEWLKTQMANLNWIKILEEAIEARPSSWGFQPVGEWGNASDEVYIAVIRAMQNAGILDKFHTKPHNHHPIINSSSPEKSERGRGKRGNDE